MLDEAPSPLLLQKKGKPSMGLYIASSALLVAAGAGVVMARNIGRGFSSLGTAVQTHSGSKIAELQAQISRLQQEADFVSTLQDANADLSDQIIDLKNQVRPINRLKIDNSILLDQNQKLMDALKYARNKNEEKDKMMGNLTEMLEELNRVEGADVSKDKITDILRQLNQAPAASPP